MNYELKISARYLFSKKSTNVINVISGISVVGVIVATMALVVVMSVFNGFHDMVESFFTQFDPQLEIVPTKGKTVAADHPSLDKIRKMAEVDVATESVEDQALAMYGERQAMIIVKGVADNFQELTHINDILYGEGSFDLHAADLQYGIPGIRLAQELGLGARWQDYLQIYAPRRDGQLDMTSPMDALVNDSLLSAGVVFCVQQGKYDKNYMLTSLQFAQMLFGCPGELSSLGIRLKPGSNLPAVKEKMQAAVGDEFKVKDRYEQQEETFSIMQIEKVIAYLFLTFILVVACFNIISSLSMLIIDKEKDMVTLRALGARQGDIRKIFFYEGCIINAIGAVTGTLLGLLLCWLQQEYGLVRLGASSGSFVVDAYPVSVHYTDVALVFATVLVVGTIAVLIPSRKA